MRKKLKDLAKLLEAEATSAPETPIKGVAPIDQAKEGDMVFVTDAKSLEEAEKSAASAVIAPLKSSPRKPAILVKNPRLAMARILDLFRPDKPAEPEIHKTVVSGKNVKIGKGTSVGAHAFLGDDVRIGLDCIIHPNVSIYDGTVIGNRVIIHSNSVIGVDGFGFEPENGKHVKIPQIGNVVIEDDVEIYANCTVARGTMRSTTIGRGTKLDCGVHIAHNCTIGEDCAIAAHVALAGGAKLGNRIYVGGQAAFSNRVTVGDNTVVMAKSGVTKDFPANSVISGFPAQEHKKELEAQAIIRRLPGLIKKILKEK